MFFDCIRRERALIGGISLLTRPDLALELLDTFLFMKFQPEQDIRMSECSSHVKILHGLKKYFENVFYYRNMAQEIPFFFAFLYTHPLMSYLDIYIVNAFHKLIVRK